MDELTFFFDSESFGEVAMVQAYFRGNEMLVRRVWLKPFHDFKTMEILEETHPNLWHRVVEESRHLPAFSHGAN